NRDRFIARARKEGLAVSHQPSRGTAGSSGRWWLPFGYPRLAALAIVVLVLTVGVLGYSLYQTNLRYSSLAAEKARMNTLPSQQTGLRTSSPQENLPASLPPVDTSPQPAATLTQRPDADVELTKALNDRDAAAARSKDLESQLTEFATELQALRN